MVFSLLYLVFIFKSSLLGKEVYGKWAYLCNGRLNESEVARLGLGDAPLELVGIHVNYVNYYSGKYSGFLKTLQHSPTTTSNDQFSFARLVLSCTNHVDLDSTMIGSTFIFKSGGEIYKVHGRLTERDEKREDYVESPRKYKGSTEINEGAYVFALSHLRTAFKSMATNFFYSFVQHHSFDKRKNDYLALSQNSETNEGSDSSSYRSLILAQIAFLEGFQNERENEIKRLEGKKKEKNQDYSEFVRIQTDFYLTNKMKEFIGDNNEKNYSYSESEYRHFIGEAYKVLQEISLFFQKDTYSGYVVPVNFFSFDCRFESVFVVVVDYKEKQPSDVFKKDEVIFKDLIFFDRDDNPIFLEEKDVKISNDSEHLQCFVCIDKKVIIDHGVEFITLNGYKKKMKLSKE